VEINFDNNLSWEPGVEWGAIRRGDRFSAGLRGWHTWGVLGYDDQRHKVEIEGRSYLSRSTSLGISMIYQQEEDKEKNLVTFNFYRTF
jgi:hypothetical protein